jgi:hypothetical protein
MLRIYRVKIYLEEEHLKGFIYTGLSDDDGSTQKSIVIDLEIDDESTLSEFLHTGVQTTRMLVVGARFWLSKQINCSYS